MAGCIDLIKSIIYPLKKLSGESPVFGSTSSLKEWKDVSLWDIVESYERADVLNANECGLFYRILADRTMCFKGENVSGEEK